jgi:spermidine/putrescine transport system permease protein
MAVVLMLVIALSIGASALVLWLIALPFRARNRLVLGPSTGPSTGSGTGGGAAAELSEAAS